MKKEILISLTPETAEIKVNITGLNNYEVIGILEMLSKQLSSNATKAEARRPD